MKQNDKNITNPELKRAIARMYREGTRASKEEALRALTRAQLLAPVVVEKQGKQDRIRFMLLPKEDGSNYLPAFTDLEQLRKRFTDPGQQTLVLSFAEYANMILRDNSAAGIVVDPFGENMVIGRELVELIAGDTGTLRARMKLSKPEPWPTVMAKALGNQAALLADVRRMWLCWAEDACGGQGYLLLVEHNGPSERIFGALAQAARPHLEGKRADIASYDARYEQAVRQFDPIFKR